MAPMTVEKYMKKLKFREMCCLVRHVHGQKVSRIEECNKALLAQKAVALNLDEDDIDEWLRSDVWVGGSTSKVEAETGDGLEEGDEGEAEEDNEAGNNNNADARQPVSDTDGEKEDEREKQSDKETAEASTIENIKENVIEEVNKFAEALQKIAGTTEKLKQPPGPMPDSMFRAITAMYFMWKIQEETLFEEGVSENDDVYKKDSWRRGWIMAEKEAMDHNLEEYLEWKVKKANSYSK
jgi:hypothetical protein